MFYIRNLYGRIDARGTCGKFYQNLPQAFRARAYI
jgi:hypothetical protein